MGRAYSDDLRCKFLAAYERGEETLQELSVQFGVSLSYAKKIRQQFLRTGEMKRVPQSRYGCVSRVTSEAESLLRGQVRTTPDATIAELRLVLLDKLKIEVSRAHMGRLLNRLNLRLKKSRSMPASRTRRRAVATGRRGGTR